MYVQALLVWKHRGQIFWFSLSLLTLWNNPFSALLQLLPGSWWVKWVAVGYEITWNDNSVPPELSMTWSSNFSRKNVLAYKLSNPDLQIWVEMNKHGELQSTSTVQTKAKLYTLSRCLSQLNSDSPWQTKIYPHSSNSFHVLHALLLSVIISVCSPKSNP